MGLKFKDISTYQCLSLGFWGLFVTSSVTLATTFANRPITSVVKEAPAIVQGRARNSHSDWGKASGNQKAIFTYTEFDVIEVLKGPKLPHLIILRAPGGEKDGIEMSVPGTANFTSGDEIVVTLAAKDPSDESYEVLNLSAGKYNLVKENNEVLLVNSLGGGEVYEPGKGYQELSYNSKIPLAAFKEIIRHEEKSEAEGKELNTPKLLAAKQIGADSSAQKGLPIDLAPVPSVKTVPSPDAASSNNTASYGFLFLFLISALGLWILFSRGSGDQS